MESNPPASGVQGGSPPPEAPSAESLRQALKSSGWGTFDLDPAADTVACDAPFREVLGVPCEVRLGRRSLRECVHPDHRDRLDVLVGRVTGDASSGIFHEEFRCAAPRGNTQRWALASGEVFFDSHHRPVRVLGTLQDVTDRKLSEQQNERFLQGLGNDLKQSLDELMATVQDLLKVEGGPHRQSMVERVVATRLQLTRGVDELQNYTRAGRAGAMTQPEAPEGAGGSLFPEVTAHLFGALPLQEREPRAFAGLLEKYSRLLELALDRHTYKLANDRLSTELREVAERLGAMRGGAREVADLHSQALAQMSRGSGQVKAHALVSEGRLLSFELMGYLLSFYRGRAGFGPRRPGPEPEDAHG